MAEATFPSLKALEAKVKAYTRKVDGAVVLPMGDPANLRIGFRCLGKAPARPFIAWLSLRSIRGDERLRTPETRLQLAWQWSFPKASLTDKLGLFVALEELMREYEVQL